MDGQKLAEQQKFELLDNRLTEVHKNKLFALNQDSVLLEALETVLLYSLYEMGTIKQGDNKIHEVNWAFGIGYNLDSTDEQVGKALRVRTMALSLLEDGFRQVKKFAEHKVTMAVEEKNPAL